MQTPLYWQYWHSIALQGLFVLFACIESSDPVRVLRLFHNKYTGYNWRLYCWSLCKTCHYQSYVLLYCVLPMSILLKTDWTILTDWLAPGAVLELTLIAFCAFIIRTVYFGTVRHLNHWHMTCLDLLYWQYWHETQ